MERIRKGTSFRFQIANDLSGSLSLCGSGFIARDHILPRERRNSVEAAKWLWKAMAKHNGSASVLLADLYLKGDGVPKNCDQARILLDSAALRGTKDAGERLRHLQAFGCN